MKDLILFVFILGFTLSSSADMVEQIGGSQPKEQEIRWLWKYLPDFIRACVSSGAECQEPEIKKNLSLALQLLPKTPQSVNSANGQQLVFISEKEKPALFKSDAGETHRLAVTQPKPGSPIYINSDRMDISSEKWVGILTHELMHHAGLPDDSHRLTDRIGAAVASHLASTWHRKTLEEFGHPQTEVVLFSDPSRDRPLRALVKVLNFSVDVSATPNSRVPICAPSEKFQGQTSAALLWRVVQVSGDKGRVRIRGSARVSNYCRTASGTVREVPTNFTIFVALYFPKEFDSQSNWWQLPSSIAADSIVAGNSDDKPDYMDLFRTFRIESIHSISTQLAPGQTWKTKVIVESLDGAVPQECMGALTGSKWFFSRIQNMSMFEPFDSCHLKSMGPNKWQVDLQYTFPEGARSDLFALSFLHFNVGSEARYALPARPIYTSLVNKSELPPLKIRSWNVIGLEDLNTWHGQPLKHSFSVPPEKTFYLELYCLGQEKIGWQVFDLDFIVNYKGSQIVAPENKFSTDMPEMLLDTEIKPAAGGFVIRYKLKLPAQHSSGLPIDGIKLRGLSIQTNDFSWVSMEIPLLTEALFMKEGAKGAE